MVGLLCDQHHCDFANLDRGIGDAGRLTSEKIAQHADYSAPTRLPKGNLFMSCH
jgi:hypothetical protein